jgi:hypothetical protein
VAAELGFRALFVVMAFELGLGALALRRVREPVRAGSPSRADEQRAVAACTPSPIASAARDRAS